MPSVLTSARVLKFWYAIALVSTSYWACQGDFTHHSRTYLHRMQAFTTVGFQPNLVVSRFPSLRHTWAGRSRHELAHPSQSFWRLTAFRCKLSSEFQLASAPHGLVPPEDLTIVGGGVCGFFLALLLAQMGRRVRLFEQGPARPAGQFGFLLNSRGLSALEAYDSTFVSRLCRVGNPTTKLSVIVRGQNVSETAVRGITVLRATLLEEMLKDIDQYSNLISVYHNHKLLGLDSSKRALTFEKTDTAETFSLHASCVIACDGNYSCVRKELENLQGGEHAIFSPSVIPWGFSIRCISIDRDPDGFDVSTHYVYGDIGYICRVASSRWVLALGVDQTEPADSFLNSTEPTESNMLKLRARISAASAAAGVKELELRQRELASFFMSKKVTGALVEVPALATGGWLAMAGDAAHAVSPFAGEGANASLEDAVILANAIRHAGRDGFEEFDRRRCADARALFRIARYRNTGIAGSPSERVDYFVDSILISLCRRLGIFDATQQELMQTTGDQVETYTHLEELHEQQLSLVAPISTLLKGLTRMVMMLTQSS